MLERSEVLSALKRYKEKNAEVYGIDEIGIFGSYARDSADDNSDIDVFVKLRHANLFMLSRMRIELEELFGVHTDIVQLRDRMNEYLKKHIEAEAISAWGSSSKRDIAPDLDCDTDDQIQISACW